MIPNINIILAIKTENIVFAICLAIIITMTYFILPLSIATISTTLKVVFFERIQIHHTMCLFSNQSTTSLFLYRIFNVYNSKYN